MAGHNVFFNSYSGKEIKEHLITRLPAGSVISLEGKDGGVLLQVGDDNHTLPYAPVGTEIQVQNDDQAPTTISDDTGTVATLAGSEAAICRSVSLVEGTSKWAATILKRNVT